MNKGDNDKNIEHLRHSLAHLLGAAVLEIYTDAKLTIGPAIDNGFYYDVHFSKNLSSDDLPKIEAKMKSLMKSWKKVSHKEVSKKEALDFFKGNEFKKELIEEIEKKGEKITLYTMGEFTDLCRGGHIDDLSDIDPESFKLDRISGSYWRGNENNPMLTRIYGLAFHTKEELDALLNIREEAKKRDHRKLGVELDLFTFSDLVGPGLPLYTPKGTILRQELAGFSESLQKRYGFQQVWIPHITRTELYKKSGHWDKFGGELMLVKSQESSDEFVLKPMNCPHHAQIYASKPRSYRDLPIRLMETTTCYRDEKTGELSGLTRVRSLTQDDAHVFCRMDQVEQEFENIMSMIKEMYGKLGLKFHARLSFSDPTTPEKYLGSKENWVMAEGSIEKIAKKLELDYFVAPGEAAFYGPKIDIMVTDAIGREWQCATQQLDFVQPERFELEYTAEDGTKKRPVMVHKALLGTIDRFLGVFIEHTAGSFPVWMSPVQVSVIPVGEKFYGYAEKIKKVLEENNVRVNMLVDDSLGKRIRQAKTEKVPYQIVVGEKEESGENITVEGRNDLKLSNIQLIEFVSRITEEIKNRKDL
jgi:threonyl-tRNA synthetase